MTDYAKGFKDGFAAGLEEGKKLVEDRWRKEQIKKIEDDLHKLPKPQPRLDDYIFGAKEKCPKCGISLSGVMGYVCSSPNCPTFPQVTCEVGRPLTGAVGAVNIDAPAVDLGGWDGKGSRHGWYDHHGKWQPDRGR
jgi:hypothetical protein